MTILRLRPQERELFDWLDPFGYLDRLELPHYFALAALADYGEADEEDAEEDADTAQVEAPDASGYRPGELPAGLMVCSVEPARLVIEWLCVEPQMQGRGIGAELLEKACFLALQIGREEVAARFVDAPETGRICRAAESYFAECLFEKSEELPGEWDIDARRLRDIPFFLQDPGKFPKAEALGTLSGGRARAAIEELQEEKGTFRMCALDPNPLYYDADISSVLLDHGEACGLFLAIRTGDTVYPVMLYAESEREEAGLLLQAAEGMRETVPGGTIYLMPRERKVGKKLAEYFPKERMESHVLVRVAGAEA